ncbi:MAG TPA: DUF4097 family beta strand repeat-containing protein [Candidatus Aquilonibacter sp.]|nr:DUF4097 family beta strand repeat-containing protein [Candidatus Aquilonibacter sp.]
MRSAILALLVVAAFVGCARHVPYVTRVGILNPTSTMTVVLKDGNLNVYKPADGEPEDEFTVAASALPGTNPAAPTIARAGNGIVVRAVDPLFGMLVRLPDRVDLVAQSEKGNINVTDVSGNITVHAGKGNVKIMVSGIAQASTGTGDVDVTMGATHWKGTLKFSADSGDVTVYLPETAKFHARLHTDDGTIFTDFGLRGTSQGSNETIDAPVNGGSHFGVDIESHRGTVRLLRLTPQA